MPREYHFWVYILASRSRNLYIGMTNSLTNRVATHRQQLGGTHTADYNIHRLVYFEYFRYVRSAITREKQLKHWTRAQKIALIESVNPTWEDLIPPSPAKQPKQQIPTPDDRSKPQKRAKQIREPVAHLLPALPYSGNAAEHQKQITPAKPREFKTLQINHRFQRL